MTGKSLTVREYSDVVLSKYVDGAFSANPQENLEIAAEEVYVLLRKLQTATGDKSEDAKTPLKAIRDALEKHTPPADDKTKGVSPAVDKLFCLYEGLENLCQDRIASAPGVERDAAAQIQDSLRYRLTRLVTGDTWDSRPQLKARVLKLMFQFMVRENERLMSGSRTKEGVAMPGLRLSRQISWGRRQAAAAAGIVSAPKSKWQDSIAELNKMPGSRLLPLIKLLLMENLELSGGLGAIAGLGAAPPTPSFQHDNRGASTSPPGSAAPRTPPQAMGTIKSGSGGINMDDLLGLGADLPQEDAQSRRSSSPSVSAMAGPEDLFTALTDRHPDSQPAFRPPAPESVYTQLSSMSISGAVNIPSGMATPCSLPTSAPYHSLHAGPGAFPGGAGAPHPGQGGAYAGGAPYGSAPSHSFGMPLSPTGQQQHPALYRQSSGGSQLQGQGSGGAPFEPPPYFDANSPYFGKPQPFADNRFSDLASVTAGHRRPPPPPPRLCRHGALNSK